MNFERILDVARLNLLKDTIAFLCREANRAAFRVSVEPILTG
ncbi:hypothetical protein THTE_0681 [Thermogutta terrifontis]|uniref:Uncharacterized protein n=1 Tax=Thermogutta terrifontis TaxID=1331910 RepID=A0A286RBE3_9BACT|nr:hypothetical protein THTE_0681 [Thermogutta terrifontis]